MEKPKPASFLSAEAAPFCYIEKSNPHSSNLQELTYGIYEMNGPFHSGMFAHPVEEALLFCLKGKVNVALSGQNYCLEHYDVLYIPRGATYQLTQSGGESKIVICRARSEKTHPVFYASWKDFSVDEKRIRHLKGKDVFLMFDVSETAEKLMAGYTIFQPGQRSWPPHNHTDQEEVYIFTKGRGAMEVYADEEDKSFVRSVREGDAVTIPLLNYHPVFSQDEELHFIWCIAGNRYWIGDKHKDFMTGQMDKLTT
ncbi:MAG: 5-deoxy-glucuronate isomerase [Verrucomicrobiota bacterium]|nr:5-deoxy-glucuronate isomerase [Verrucomicrobiota bacterium]